MNTKRFPIFVVAALAALWLLCLAATNSSLAAISSQQPKHGIGAVVNDEVITLSDVRSRTSLAAVAAKASAAQIQKRALETLIDEQLQMQEAKKLGITITDEQIDGGFASIARQNGMTPEKFKAMLAEKKVSVASLRAQIRAQIAWSYVVRRKLRPQISVSESDIDAVFDRMERSADKPEYHLAEIFLAVETPSEDEFVKGKALELIDKMLKGASFSSIAREHSQAAGADKGGDLGWIAADQLQPAISEALTRIKPGQISPPIRGTDGYHIVYLLDEREKIKTSPVAAAAPATTAHPDPGKAVQALHLKRIVIPVEKNDPATVIAAKTARARQLSREIENCAAMEKKSADFISPATGDLGFVDPANLPEAVSEALATLPDGKLSAPITVESGLAVVMICGRKELPAPAAPDIAAPKTSPLASPDISTMRNNQATREKIANDLGMERLDMLQQRYLQDLRASAFIEKRI